MAYRDDVATLNPSHAFYFDGNANDSIGSANGTNSGGIFSAPSLTEDATSFWRSNGTTDRITLPSTSTINSSAQTRKAVAGWFRTTDIQTPPKRIYGEGNNSTTFQFVMAYGNNVMFEVVEPSNFTIQIYGPPLQPNRIYHLCAIFEGSGFGNVVRFYVDGVEQTLAEPTNRQPGTPDLNSRGIGEFADPAGTVGVGGDVVILNAPVNGDYQHWYFWDGAAALLSATDIREILFEKGVKSGTTIFSNTEAGMQSDLDIIAGSARIDQPLNLRIEAPTGDGDLTLTADNITHDPLASIHIQFMGTGTLTWVNSNGSNATIASTPNGGTIIFVNPATLSINSLIADSEVRVYEAGTTTELAGVENSGTSFSVELSVNSVDIVIHKVDYENIRLEGIDLSAGDVSITAQQVFDRQFENP